MYKAFRIEESEVEKILKNTVVGKAKNTLVENFLLEEKLRQVLSKKDSVKAEKIWDNFFPKIDVPVFISHSSKDGDLAKRFANWLYNTFKIESFIDSKLWGHSDKLLREIDNKYCSNKERGSYSYEKRNGSTAHVHIILTHALTRMIDHAECFIFIDSNNSISIEDSVSGTSSPWIFHELATVNTIRENIPERHKQKEDQRRTQIISKGFSESREDFHVHFPDFSKDLKALSSSNLELWEEIINRDTVALDALDILYNLDI